MEAGGFAEGRMSCGPPWRVTRPSGRRGWRPDGRVGYPQVNAPRSA